ncbi:hypothetical protein [Actinacidiphila sp. ITFR-21]|uniref:hypothetical protein n=1 Tax=Actinacidiphila sp. ITFR-21 TaxID=3075199 RepID=UPI00288C3EC8|nr:hypothetical protein [Streptomyces sp. ITFR-21]WNI18582.1 hypothetical protein RLT57_25645 [Streptomyces sp. ITFR-21]
MTTTPDRRTAPAPGAEADDRAAGAPADPADPADPPDAAHPPNPAGPADAADPPAATGEPVLPRGRPGSTGLPEPRDPFDASHATQAPAPPVQSDDPTATATGGTAAPAAAPFAAPVTTDPPPDDQPEQMSTPQTFPSQHPAGVQRARRGPRPPRDAPRWVRWTVLPLLVLVPIGYVAVSAEQSRDSGEDKQQEAAVRHLTRAKPSSLQQRIYQVPFPAGARNQGYLETNSWDVSVLFAQFTTTAGGLDTFLAKTGTSRTALRPGHDTITPVRAARAGWDFTVHRSYAGIALHQVGDKPDHDIMVDLTDPDAPSVYVVSTVNFQHGFGGG